MTPAEQIAAKHNAGVAKPGHNSAPDVAAYADRLETLEEEKKVAAENIRELKAEAKAAGVDPRVLAAAVKARMESPDAKEKRVAFEEKLDRYKLALGLLD